MPQPPNVDTDAEKVAAEAARLIAPVYRAEDWTWGSLGVKVPSEEDIKRALISRINSMQSEDLVYSSSGGLVVERVSGYDGEPEIKLYFHLGTVDLEDTD
jgi:hypothetical protein